MNIPYRGLVVAGSIEQRHAHMAEALTHRWPRLTAAPIDDAQSLTIACYGPSLADTWSTMRRPILSMSGATRFLADRGLTPDWHCLPADAVVETEGGPRAIGALVDSTYRGRVWAIDADGRFVLCRVTATSRRSSRGQRTTWVDLRFSGRGNKRNLRCTADHRVGVIDDLLRPVVAYREAGACAGAWVARKPYARSSRHVETSLFNANQVSALIGCLLGDGHLAPDGALLITHGHDQYAYLDTKQRLFGGTVFEGRAEGFGVIRPRRILRSPVNGQTKYLRALMYPDGHNKVLPPEALDALDEIALAYWYMDDGSLRLGSGRGRPHALFCTEGFAAADIERLRIALQKRWGFEPQLAARGRIRLRCDDSARLFEAIAPVVHPDLEYKLPAAFRGWPKREMNLARLDLSAALVRGVSVLPPPRRGGFHGGALYDLSIEGVHNFVANDCVVHNCDMDPRPHKVRHIDPPIPGVHYLMASVCHPRTWEVLRDQRVTLWHMISSHTETPEWVRQHDPGQLLVNAGSSIGIAALHLGGLLGFRHFEIHGMDSSKRGAARHAGPHYGHPQGGITWDAERVTYATSRIMSNAAVEMLNLIEWYPVFCVFHGDGLLQGLIRKRNIENACHASEHDKAERIRRARAEILVEGLDAKAVPGPLDALLAHPPTAWLDELHHQSRYAESRRPRARFNTGTLAPPAAFVLRALSEVLAPKVVVEVGTFIGTSTLALATRAGHVYTCDKDNDCLPSTPTRTCYPYRTSTEMFAELVAKGVRADLFFFDGRIQLPDLPLILRLSRPGTVYVFDDHTGQEKGVVNVARLRPFLPRHTLVEPDPSMAPAVTLAMLLPEAR